MKPSDDHGAARMGVTSRDWSRRKAGSRKDISKIQMELTCLNTVALLESLRRELVMGTQNDESKKINKSMPPGKTKKSHAKGSVMLSWNNLTNVHLGKKKKKQDVY